MSADLQYLKDHIKWLEQRCKALKAELVKAEAGAAQFGIFEDCGQFYEDQVTEYKARLDEAVNIKVSTEKYFKKLKHEARERMAAAEASDTE